MPEERSTQPASTRRRPGPLSMALVGAVVVGTLVGVALLARTQTPSTPASWSDASATPAVGDKWADVAATPSTTTIRCTWFGPANQYDDGYCDRMAADAARRRPLAEPDRAAAQAKAKQITAALRRPTVDCAQLSEEDCLARQARQRMFALAESPEQLADRIRGSLRNAGLPEVTVRPAGPEDPAPRDAVIFAVPVGVACLLGYVHPRRKGDETRVVGELPEGGCLPG
ncbi:hypothetical protein AB0H57_19790 [Micromonospora sp. NPDC050686]|uniref:hypothetical protein n=1 Tax=Micromonospora sp. NPDC050686 TaxID=3154631 RepID=UPI003409FA34